MPLEIEYLSPDGLSPHKRNARRHPRKQLRQLAGSIKAFGFLSPVLVNADRVILAGHARVEAAKLAGLTEIPTVRVETLTPQEERAFILADNKLAANAGWDEERLAEELQALLDFDVDLDVTGFSLPEVDSLIDGLRVEEPDNPADDSLPDPAACPPRCALGDVWQMGQHRLVCGDALDPAVVGVLMDGNSARLVVADPPYNLNIAGHVSGLGRTKHREFAMASGEMTSPEFTAFLKSAFLNLAANSVDGSIHLVFMDWRHLREILDAADGVYAELKNLVVWVKDNGGMGTFYRSRHELIFVFKNGTAPHVNNFELGQHGRYRTNVWQYRGVNTFKAGREEELSLHPTTKPVQMLADAIKDLSARGDIVLDLFGGSGSTLIAAEKTGRRAYLCELDPVYCDRILQRWETFAKDEAELLVAGPDQTRGRR